MKAILAEQFFHEGRGPELLRVHLSPHGASLVACDFLTPDDTPDQVKHLRFLKPQAFMFTPEEVENVRASVTDWAQTGNAALVSLGRSSWLESFSPERLATCQHYRAMFYDYYLDIICEGVEVHSGGYAGAQPSVPSDANASRHLRG
jgi:hypothetical protein